MIHEQNRAFAATVEFAVKVARFVLDVFTGPVGWARAAWRIYQLFRESFSQVARAVPSAPPVAPAG